MLMVFRGTNSTETYALPVARWQSRQWQLAVITGSAEHSYRTAPHIQPPVKGVAITELLLSMCCDMPQYSFQPLDVVYLYALYGCLCQRLPLPHVKRGFYRSSKIH